MENKLCSLPTTPELRTCAKGSSYIIPLYDEEEAVDQRFPEDEQVILELQPFVKAPQLDFGTVSIGVCTAREIWIQNSYEDAVEVSIDKLPMKDNFEADPVSMLIEGGDRRRMVVRWCPMKEGGTRKPIRLIVNDAFRLQFFVLGVAKENSKTRKTPLWSKHPGSKKKLLRSCQGSQSCYLLDDPHLPVKPKDRVEHDSLDCRFQSKSWSFITDGSEENFQDEEQLRIRRETYVKRERAAGLQPLDSFFNNNNSNKEGSTNQKTSKRQLLPASNDAQPLPSLRKPSLNQPLPLVKFSDPFTPPAQPKRIAQKKQQRFEGPICHTEEITNHLSMRRLQRDKSSGLRAQKISVKTAIHHKQPNYFIEELLSSPEDNGTLVRHGTYSKLDEEVGDDAKLQLKSNPLENVQRKFEHSTCQLFYSQPEIHRSLPEGLNVKEDEKIVLNDDQDTHLQKKELEEFLLMSYQKTTENVKFIISFLRKPIMLVSECDYKLYLSPKGFEMSSKISCFTSKASVESHGNGIAGNLPDVCPLPASKKEANSESLKLFRCNVDFASNFHTSSKECRSTNAKEASNLTKQISKCSKKAIIKTKRGLATPVNVLIKLHSGDYQNSSDLMKFPKAASSDAVEHQQRSPSQILNRKPRFSCISNSQRSNGKLRLIKGLKESSGFSGAQGIPRSLTDTDYNEKYLEKQERGFVRWINFIVAPNRHELNAKDLQDAEHELTSGNPVEGKLLTKEALALEAYWSGENLRQLREEALGLFMSHGVHQVVCKVESEAEKGRLAIRTDRFITNDQGLRIFVGNLLFSYELLWLGVGLETVWGKQIFGESYPTIQLLERFLSENFFSNLEITLAYAHPTINNVYLQGFQNAMSKFILKKFISLVYFLDVAKSQKLIKYDPCLFSKDSSHKSSRSILLEFSHECLRGEGDLIKHLFYMGCNVVCSQTTLDEFDCRVNNLSRDLSDGIRLARLLDVLSVGSNISHSLALPPLSKAKKLHNVQIVLNVLKKMQVSLKIDPEEPKKGEISPKDIVNGHRERTLQLLWRIVLSVQMNLLLVENTLKEEIEFLLKNVPMDSKDCSFVPDSDFRRGLELYAKEPQLAHLLKWCQVVCAKYGVMVNNFTTSFLDGRAFCYLIHHYHPTLIPLPMINNETTQTVHGFKFFIRAADGDGEKKLQESEKLAISKERWKQLIKNEKDNLMLFKTKMLELGGIPLMKNADMLGAIPDEKLIIITLMFLCSQLLVMRQRVRAATFIQRTWRKIRRSKQKPDKIVQKLSNSEKAKHGKPLKVSGDLTAQQKQKLVELHNKMSTKEVPVSTLKNTNCKSASLNCQEKNLLSSKLTNQEDSDGGDLKKNFGGMCSAKMLQIEEHTNPNMLARKDANDMESSTFENKYEMKSFDRMFATDALSNEISLCSVSLNYNDEVIENLGLNMVDEIGTIYHTPKKNTPIKKCSSITKSKTSQMSLSSVDALSKETSLISVSLNYNDEVVENLGLNMVDKIGTIYHTPKKDTPIKKCSSRSEAQMSYSAPRPLRSVPKEILEMSPELIPVDIQLQDKNVFNASNKENKDFSCNCCLKELNRNAGKFNIGANNGNLADFCFSSNYALRMKKTLLSHGTRSLMQNFFIEVFNAQSNEEPKDDDIHLLAKFDGSAKCSGENASSSGDALNTRAATDKKVTIDDCLDNSQRELATDEDSALVSHSVAHVMTPDKIACSSPLSINDMLDDCCAGIHNLSLESPDCKKKEGKRHEFVCDRKELRSLMCRFVQLSAKFLLAKNDPKRLMGHSKIKFLVTKLHLSKAFIQSESFIIKNNPYGFYVNNLLMREFLANLVRIITGGGTRRSWLTKMYYDSILASDRDCLLSWKLSRCMRDKLILLQVLNRKCTNLGDESHNSKSQCLSNLGKDLSEVVFIQESIKEDFAEAEYEEIVRKVINAQAYIRAFLTRRRIKNYLNCIVSLQSAAREYLDRNKHVSGEGHENVIGQNEQIQLLEERLFSKLEDGWKEIMESRSKDERVKMDHSMWKGSKIHSDYSYKEMMLRVVKVQAVVRGYLVRKIFQESLKCIKYIQMHGRAYMDRQKYDMKLSKIIYLQACFRAALKRSEFLHYKRQIITAQSLVRRRLCMNHIERQRHSIILFQNAARLFLLKKITFNKGVIKVQSLVRGFLARKSYKKAQLNVTRCQAIVRGYLKKKEYEKHLRSIALVQNLSRRLLFRKNIWYQYQMAHSTTCYVKVALVVFGFCSIQYLKINQSAARIQSMWKGFLARRNFQCMIRGFIRLQALIRGHLDRSFALQKYESIILIQNWWRRTLRYKKLILFAELLAIEKIMTAGITERVKRLIMATKIQLWYRKTLKRRKENAAALKIQGLWRGYRVRIKNPLSTTIRNRLAVANKRVTKVKTLSYRTQKALDSLFKCKQLSYILEALINLDVVTTWSPECCQKMAEGCALNSIVQLIQCCNRSIPHEELLKYSISVLVNLAKCNKTADKVLLTKDLIGTVLNVMGVFKERDCIFIRSCELLTILASDETRQRVIQKIDRVAEKLTSLHAILSRKLQIEKKHLLGGSASCASVNSSSYSSGSSCEGTQTNKRKMKGHSFEMSYNAICLLMKKLSIPLK